MERKWFYYEDGKGHGPFTAKKISSWVNSGKLDASTLVWSEKLSRPKPLSEVTAFEDIQSSPDPPPIPTETSPSSDDESASETTEPPPLPSQKGISDTEKEKSASAEGPTQSEQDQKTADWMWRASLITLAVLLFSSATALFPWNDGSQETGSSSGQGVTVKQQEWPSAFDPENHDDLVDPQPPSLSEELADDIGKTFGFRYGQDHSLNRIRREYAGTSIAEEAKLSQLRFKSSFGETYDYMDSLLSQKWGEEWVQAKRRIEEQSASLLGSGSVSQAKVRAFVDTVSNRSEGRLPSPILETLLIFNPEYIERPEKMFDDGFTKEYRSHGHPKSEGIDLGIKYPASWKAEEGRRPNIVQKLTNENGHGTVMATILVREFPANLSSDASDSEFDKAILALDREEMFGSVLPSAEVVETGRARLAGEPTIWGRYQAVVNRAGRKMDFEGLAFMMARHSNMVQIMYMAGKPSGNESASARATFEHYGALFQRMTNSVDFFNRYK